MQNKDGNILIVDDNTIILNSLKQLLKYDFNKIEVLNDPRKLPKFVEENIFDVILLDMNFKAGARSGDEGIFWIKKILEIDKNSVIVLITAYGEINLAVKAIRAGGIDFVLKPWEPQKLISTLKSAIKLRRTKLEVSGLKQKQKAIIEDIDLEYGEILAESSVMKTILETIKKVAQTDANILLTGEHGTGKELVAHALHRQSLRSDKIFIKVDLGSISESLFESELFGHTKGAFTDARTDRIGRFEIASGGTLFLDEIGNLSIPLQAKLLSVIQNRKIVKIGSNKEVAFDVRLICATNQDLNQMISNKLFRDDLLYRINTIQLHVPPLRERENDVLILADYFMKIYSKKYNKKADEISQKAKEKLIAYNWPGNIRELKHTIEKAVILSSDEILNEDDFQLVTQTQNDTGKSSLRLSDIEKKTIKKVMQISRGNMSEAAKILDISRTTLYSKLTKHGL